MDIQAIQTALDLDLAKWSAPVFVPIVSFEGYALQMADRSGAISRFEVKFPTDALPPAKMAAAISDRLQEVVMAHYATYEVDTKVFPMLASVQVVDGSNKAVYAPVINLEVALWSVHPNLVGKDVVV